MTAKRETLQALRATLRTLWRDEPPGDVKRLLRAALEAVCLICKLLGEEVTA